MPPGSSNPNIIVWNEAMATGVAEIDAQHRELILHFNRLVVAIAEGKGREETGEILDFLQFYAEWHFGREERCMDEYQCPVAATNRQAHGAFLRAFKRLYDLYYQSNVDPRLISDTLKELEIWIVSHIIKVDTHLRGCVAGSTSG